MVTNYRLIMLALVQGRSWSQITSDLGCSRSSIDKASRVLRSTGMDEDTITDNVGNRPQGTFTKPPDLLYQVHGYTGFRPRLHDRSQLYDVNRSAPWNGKSGNSASASSCLSASSTLHRERSTSSSKVSTSGDLRFERKLSNLRNFESIRLPSARHKSHMGRSPETSVVQPSMHRRQCCLSLSFSAIHPQGSPWRREPSSNPEVPPLQTGIESRLRMR